MKKFFAYLTFLALIVLNGVKSDAVCDLEAFALELKQDLEDNGKLDCLRVILPPPGGLESEDASDKRLAAQWDTDCSFEAEYNWGKVLEDFGIPYLVDVNGEKVPHDFDDQADMCEIIRAALHHKKFNLKNVDFSKLDAEFITQISCYGFDNSPKICAMAEGSFYDKSSWLILLGPQIININEGLYNPVVLPKIEDASASQDRLAEKTSYENKKMDMLEKIISIGTDQLRKLTNKIGNNFLSLN